MARRKRGGGGGVSRRAALALIGGGGLLGVVGTGAVDQVDANRKSTVNTVEDKNALLKLDGFDDDEPEEPHRIKVTNQFVGELNGEIWIDGESLEFESNVDTNIDDKIELTLKSDHSYAFKIVTPSYNESSGNGNGNNNGNGNGNNNGNGNGEEDDDDEDEDEDDDDEDEDEDEDDDDEDEDDDDNSNGNDDVPPCKEGFAGSGNEPKKCKNDTTSGTATIIFEFSGEENEVVAEREITVSSI